MTSDDPQYFTLGVEEEYHLVDADTFALRDDPAAIAATIRSLGGSADREITTAQIEVATPICHTIAEVRDSLTTLRRRADGALQRFGCRLLAAGTHPFGSWREHRLTSKARYVELLER